jgi:assimilatory nitrate reductase catalytic subunit
MATALLRRFDYAALSLSGDQLCFDAALAIQPDAATLGELKEIFGEGSQAHAGGRAVCACFGVSEQAIRAAFGAGATLSDLQAELKCGTNCGSCLPELRRLLPAREASLT